MPPIYTSILTHIHSSMLSSIKKTEVVVCKEVVVFSRAAASCQTADIVSVKPFSHCCKLLKALLQLLWDRGAYTGRVTLWIYKQGVTHWIYTQSSSVRLHTDAEEQLMSARFGPRVRKNHEMSPSQVCVIYNICITASIWGKWGGEGD